MQEKHLFEYAVIRLVPRVEREEFINVGVILYCGRQKFLKTAYTLNEKRLLSFADLNIEEIKKHLQAFEKICTGDKAYGSIAALDTASRFRWLTATRSTVVQASKVHAGLCTDVALMLQRLHQQLVL